MPRFLPLMPVCRVVAHNEIREVFEPERRFLESMADLYICQEPGRRGYKPKGEAWTPRTIIGIIRAKGARSRR
jgi:hypothetical protein